MRRRSLLATVALAFAGCIDDPGGAGTTTADPTDTPTDTATPTAPPTTVVDPSLVESEFRAVDRCPAPGEADVDVGTRTVTVRGCVVGADGCTVATLDAVLFDTTAQALTAVVTTADRSGDGESCTQALVERGYRVRATFEGGLPDAVTVVHEDVDGRRTVTERSLDATTTGPASGTTGSGNRSATATSFHPSGEE